MRTRAPASSATRGFTNACWTSWKPLSPAVDNFAGVVSWNRRCSARPATRNFWRCLKKPADKIKRVGLIANPDKVNCRTAVQKAAAMIAEAGRLVLSDKATADLAGLKA